MTFANVDIDPDPTTQIAWPASNGKRVRLNEPHVDDSSIGESSTGYGSNQASGKPDKDADPTLRRMSTWDLVKLSISMAGAQVAWTVELG